MEPEAPNDPLARLAQGARVPERARLRLGVGAAVVLLIVALVVAVVVSAVAQQANQRVVAPTGAPSTSGATGSRSPDERDTEAAGAIIFVHVLGAVSRPGLFELHEGARVMDAVAAAGGLLDTADPGGVNLARVVSDGEQLVVPAIGEVVAGTAPGGAVPEGAVTPGGGPAAVVNLNTATVGDLETLPRIGPTLAQRIIDYRDANGRFGSIDDLRNVSGIGDKTFDGLKDLIVV